MLYIDTLNVDQYLSWFNWFVSGYIAGGNGDVAPMELKRFHSLNVLDHARRITGRLEETRPLPGDMGKLALLGSLLHDVGRFPQYKRFRTFVDAASENHARLSVRVIKRHGVLDGLAPRERHLVTASVFLHNRRSMPAGLPEGLADLTYVVRDSDKLDIFRVMLEHLRPGAVHDDVVLMHLAPHPSRYSESIYAQAMSRRLAEYSSMVWTNDFKILLLSWIYDLRFRASFELLDSLGYVETILGYLPRTSAMAALAERIRGDVADALSGRSRTIGLYEDGLPG